MFSKHSFKRTALLWIVAGAGVTGVLPGASPPIAHADRAWSDDLPGAWQSDDNDHYVFRSNGTYTFSSGDTSSANVSHSGTWSLRSSGTQLRLRATKRVVLEGKRRRTLKASKTFLLDIDNVDPETIDLDGSLFHRPREGRDAHD